MELTSAQNSARNVGVTTLVIGIVLLVAPSKASHLLRLGDHPAALRIIGASDLALVPGLLAGRHRSRWMTARAGFNVAIAAYCLWLVRREKSIGAGVGAIAMLAATFADSRTIATLRSGRRPNSQLPRA
jgi:hypothetical protein